MPFYILYSDQKAEICMKKQMVLRKSILALVALIIATFQAVK